MQKKCYECGTKEGKFHVVKYPVEATVGELTKENPTAAVYLCDSCYEENKDKIIKDL